MAARVLLQRRAVAPLSATLLAGGIVLFPSVAHAEAPADYRAKKPIYDDLDVPASQPSVESNPAPATQASQTSPAESESNAITRAVLPSLAGPPHNEPTTRSPTPTDRLAGHIRTGRLYLYRQAVSAEDALNAAMARAFDMERSFTSTIASLAPPRESGEKLVPGLAYTLVAGMAGSVVSRGRGFLLRASAPLALGVGCAWVVLPHTMRNVSDMAWRYEQRFPAVAEAHVRAREGVERGWRFARVHGDLAVRKVDEVVGEARETVEGWVRKGK